MKWYQSIKVKLIGFFLLVSVFFLLFLVLSFSVVKESLIEKSAIEQARLNTFQIINKITETQIRMEESAVIMAFITSDYYADKNFDADFVRDLLNAVDDEHIVSGGIWFESYTVNPKNAGQYLFFNRDASKKFYQVENYLQDNPLDYRQMEFYVLGKQLKKGETFWTKSYVDPVTRVRMITIVSPIYHGERFLGVASLDIKVDHYFQNVKTLENRYVMIVDRAGGFIAKSPLVWEKIKEENIGQVSDAELSALMKYIVSNLNTHKNKVDTNNSRVKTLVSQSPELTIEDARRVVYIMENEKKDLHTNVLFIEKDPFLKESSVLAVSHFHDTDWNVIVGMSEEQLLSGLNHLSQTIIFITIIMTLLATIIGYFLLRRYFVRPLESVNAQLKDNIQEDGHYRFLKCDDKGEIGQLVYNLNSRTLALEDAQRREREEIQKRLTNEKLLIQQSKMAAMGEMMDAVAHQWKQPLNALSMYSEIIKSDFADGSVDRKYIDEFSQNIQIQIDHMVDTLDEFRSFFRPDKENEDFTVSEVIDSVMFLTKDEFMKNRIVINVEKESEIKLYGSKNEFKHLILNIINNAKDAFNDNNIEEKRMITIRLLDGKAGRKIEIEDNAGGIPEEVIPDIFKANVTTKEEGKGTGIGLYMSTQIAEKYGAVLTVENRNEGACFTISFEE